MDDRNQESESTARKERSKKFWASLDERLEGPFQNEIWLKVVLHAGAALIGFLAASLVVALLTYC